MFPVKRIFPQGTEEGREPEVKRPKLDIQQEASMSGDCHVEEGGKLEKREEASINLFPTMNILSEEEMIHLLDVVNAQEDLQQLVWTDDINEMHLQLESVFYGMSSNDRFLVSRLTEDQCKRFFYYRMSKFPDSKIKMVMEDVANVTVPTYALMAMSGIAKEFIGEIIEGALDVRDKWNEPGPIQPKHIRESVRTLKEHSNRFLFHRPTAFPM